MKVNPKLAIAITLLFLPFAFTAKGQYYPGGLGNGNLFLWLDANNSSSITRNAANQVSQWADLSGNGFNFSQATAAQRPVYGAAASPTARPGLTFTSTSSQYLSIVSLPATLSFTAGVSAFTQVSYNAPQTAQGWQRIFDFGNGAGSNNFMTGRRAASASTYYEGWNGAAGDQTWTTTNAISNGTEALYEAVQQPGAAGTLTAVAFYLSGANQAANGSAGANTHIPNAIVRTSNYVGRSNWAADNYFSGTMSEILLYNTACNTTQRVILENYLSAKWNQAVSVTKYTPPSTTTYTTNLIGIGYTSAADNFLTDVATSTDGLGFSSGATATDFLGSPGYLMAAHNGQANTILTNIAVTGIGASVDYWNRSWYLNATGGNSSGNVTLNFNFSNYNGSGLPGAANYFLVYNATDGSFASGTNQVVAVNTAAAGSTVSFMVKASSLATGYYTLMWWPSGGGVTPSATSVCGGGNISFTASTWNGAAYQWQVNTGSGFANVPATDPGGAIYSGATSTTLGITGVTSSMNGYTYQVILTPSNGPAITEGPSTLTVNTAAAEPLSSTANPVCAGGSTTLSITGPVAGVNYNIYSDPALTVLAGTLTSAANSLVLSPATTTTYYEQAVQTASGCVQTGPIQTLTISVNPAPAAQSLSASASPICAGSSTTLSITGPVAGVTYNIYSDPALTVPVGTLTSVANALVLSPAVTTTYYEQAVETATGCVQTTASQTITVTVNPTPAGQALAASASPICAGGSTTLSITGPVVGVTYNIYSDPALTVPVGTLTSVANALMVIPAATTTYYEQAETALGCLQTTPVQSTVVTLNANPVLTTVENPILCIGLPDTLSATAPGAQVTWLGYDPGDSIIVSPATTTTYVAVAENAAKCTDTAIITVQVIDFKISLTASPDPIVAGFPVSLAATSSMPYQVVSWEPSGQFPDQTASTQTFTIIDTSQIFSVTGINDNGCLDTASITVVVQPNLGDFFIPNAFTPNGDGRNDVFMVYGSSIRDIDIRIFNQWGQLVFESQDAQRGWDGSYGGHQQPAGVYLYVIKVDLYGQPRTIYKKGSLNLIR
jgi:gliding motility-associated-like protein